MSKVRSINDNKLASLAATGVLTITPNNRTASNLTTRVVDYVLNNTSKKACKTPNIIPLSLWVSTSFKELRSANIYPFNKLSIIGDSELISYWIKAMHFDDLSESLVNPSEWISDAIGAEKALSRWLISDFRPDTPLSASFQRWRHSVNAELAKKGFVTSSGAILLIINAIKEKQLKLPKNVFLYAFDEQPPLYKKLFDTIEAMTSIEEVNPIRDSTVWSAVATNDAQDQFETVAKWASKIVEMEPSKTVAIVCPDMKKHKDNIIKNLNDVFEPQWILPENHGYSAPYDVSLGVKLIDIPLYNRALYYLGIIGEEINTEEVINFVNDPFTIKNRTSKIGRRKFASSLRDNRSLKTSIKHLAMKSGCPADYASAINKFININSTHPQMMLPSRWAHLFYDALNAIEWSVGVKLSEIELLGVDKWKSVLDGLTCLDIHTGEIPRTLAYKILNQLCVNALVTPPSKGSPISVMGTLEAAGLDFDYIWVLDCNDNVFPAPASTNPCLPVQLQIQENMPHSSGEKENEFTKMLFARYSGSCEQLYTSYIEADELGPKKPASILSLAHNQNPKESLIDTDLINYQEIGYQQYALSEQEDIVGKMILKGNTVSGGVGVVEQLFLCDMQAVTSKRLNVGDHKPNYTMGFTGAERGNMMHAALESFWGSMIGLRDIESTCTDQSRLKEMGSTVLLQMIEKAVDVAFFWVDREDIVTELIDQERRLMTDTLSQWLSLEADRQPFNVIALEKTDFVEVGQYRIRIRKDRIDDVIISENSHKTLALDYKSREELISTAFAHSPKTQLPLAALSEEVDGVGYMNVIHNNPTISGIADGEGLDSFKSADSHGYNAPKSWDGMKEDWLNKFTNKVDNYVNGNVNYTPSAKACVYCVKKSLCQYAVA